MGYPLFNLKPLTEEYLERVLTWRNQKGVRENMYSNELISLEQHQCWYKGLSKDTTQHQLLFCQNEEPIGSLSYTDLVDRRGTVGYYLGEKTTWIGAGLLLEFVGIEYAFFRLAIGQLTAEVLDFNIVPQKLHTLFGFQYTGRKKNRVTRDNKGIDALIFTYLREDWIENRQVVLQKLPRPILNAIESLQY